MCGRYTLFHPVGHLFDLAEAPELPPRYNVAPSQDVPVVVAQAGGGRVLRMMHWGLIPGWAKEPEIGSRLINARSETADEKPAFRLAFRRRRCLIPADGFYEWQKVEGGKQPFHIRLAGGGVFAFAGLWEAWDDPQGGRIESCTILTTEPNELLEPIHNRMPVILPPRECAVWLDAALTDPQTLKPLLRPYPAGQMACQAVRRTVNNPRFDSPDCLTPA